MQVTVLLFEGITALDAVGPFEVLSRAPGARVRFAGRAVGPVRCANGMLALHADVGLDAALAEGIELLVVPGGPGSRALETDDAILDFLRSAHAGSRFTTAVCTGALLLGAAGLLEGLAATTHWAHVERLAEFGAEHERDRVVRSGKVWTSAGVSAGIDMALTLLAEIGGPGLAREVQLALEYDPKPPFDAGHPDKARPEVVERLRARVSGVGGGAGDR